MARNDLTTADLQPGDLIVWKMGESDASHVEMFTGGSHFPDTSIHAVNTPAKDMTRVMPTSFSAASYKHAFRCLNADQVRKAIKYATQWAQYENRYDKPRIDVKTAYRQMHRNLGTPAPQIAAEMQRLFWTKGRFRAIKYAARRASILCYPGDDGESGHGMTCCMFAILCNQVAGIASHVNKLDSAQPFVRVSDKKMSPEDLRVLQKMMAIQGFPAGVFMEYQQYVQGLKEQNEYQINWEVAQKAAVQKGPSAQKKVGFTYYPSILMWRDPTTFATFDWSHAITPGMQLDAKIANPQHVWDSLTANIADWDYRGSMAQPNAAPPTEDQKAAYQQALQQNKAAATARRVPFGRA
jgi:hypothetical protein